MGVFKVSASSATQLSFQNVNRLILCPNNLLADYWNYKKCSGFPMSNSIIQFQHGFRHIFTIELRMHKSKIF